VKLEFLLIHPTSLLRAASLYPSTLPFPLNNQLLITSTQIPSASTCNYCTPLLRK